MRHRSGYSDRNAIMQELHGYAYSGTNTPRPQSTQQAQAAKDIVLPSIENTPDWSEQSYSLEGVYNI